MEEYSGFRIGDRVQCVKALKESKYVDGRTGTVLCFVQGFSKHCYVGVEFDDFEYGHRLESKIDHSRTGGWYVEPESLRLLTPHITDEEIQWDLFELL